ncbi:MAG: nucleotidyltransferase domain-containing protein [Acidobacteria bacterium]|nr:nucleotidyltransferase domain-containing protein [Acidobacteriota bacterium]
MATALESKLDALIANLRAALHGDLVSVVLYGSAARDEHAGEASNLNLLVVVTDDAPERLLAAAGPQKRWTKDGNPPLLFVTPRWIHDSTDVFPMEFLDMLDHRKILSGADPLAGVAVSRANLRLQCEREARSILLKLRAAWLEASGDSRALHDLVTSSLGPVMALVRGSLRLAGEPVPSRTSDVLLALARRFDLDAAPFAAAVAVKGAGPKRDSERLRLVFLRYFEGVERLGRALDALRTEPGPG